MSRPVRLLLLLTAVALSARSAVAQTAAPAAAQPTPEIYFRAPADGATVPRTFPVLFGLRNYGVAPATVNFPRTGHFHILINVEPPATGEVIPGDSLHRHYGLGQIETELTLAPGSYTLRLVLADHEHRVIGPALNSRPIRITVR
ncbi:MAG: DUF4399 domain-containing protein [Gemmatimonadaceae bacterium]|nr:DUF4399 domain-containing protein [Gemmatimonadaceae bacterium]MCW5826197.1 DUF4399 domain-containing protein [Gemmatimonadaceae bacterium]